jgi:hypothetical protein
VLVPESVEPAFLLVVEEQPAQGFVLAVVHFEAHDLVVGDDPGVTDERGEAAAELGVPRSSCL